MDAKEYGCIGGAWWLSHSCSIFLFPVGVPKRKDIVSHDNVRAGNEGFDRDMLVFLAISA